MNVSTDNNNTYNPNHYSQKNNDIDLINLFDIVFKQKLLILIILIIGVVSTYILINTLETRYKATSHILLDFEISASVPQKLAASVKKNLFDNEKILTEIEVIKSKKLASRVVKELSLVNDDEFSKKDISSVLVNSDSKFILNKFREFSVDAENLKILPPEVINPKISSTVMKFLESLEVTLIPGTTVLAVGYSSSDPYKAAFITNTIVDEYKSLKNTEATENNKRVIKWLDERLKNLRDTLLETETKIENFKKEKNINVALSPQVSDKQILSITNEYNEIKAKKEQIKLQIKQLSNDNTSNIITTLNAETLNTTIIRDLVRKKIDTNKEISSLSSRYGPKHPYMIKLNDEISDINQSIQEEVKKAEKILLDELKLTNKRLKELESEIGVDQNGVIEPVDASDLAYLRSMESEAESIRSVLKEFIEGYKKYIGSDGIQNDNVQIISYASVPQEPYFPNKALILSLSFLFSLSIGIFLAIALHKVRKHN